MWSIGTELLRSAGKHPALLHPKRCISDASHLCIIQEKRVSAGCVAHSFKEPKCHLSTRTWTSDSRYHTPCSGFGGRLGLLHKQGGHQTPAGKSMERPGRGSSIPTLCHALRVTFVRHLGQQLTPLSTNYSANFLCVPASMTQHNTHNQRVFPDTHPSFFATKLTTPTTCLWMQRHHGLLCGHGECEYASQSSKTEKICPCNASATPTSAWHSLRRDVPCTSPVQAQPQPVQQHQAPPSDPYASKGASSRRCRERAVE